MAKRYIQRKDAQGVETVDEFAFNNREERKEAKRCLNEYRIADTSASYYLSQRACKDWNN
tara:strand:- start:614 stop:793 length:180 start_codon:yes stop_codon:yes gene_type:complete